MMKLFLLLASVILLAAFSAADAQTTINSLGSGSALNGTELIPMFQTANPAVTTSPNAVRTFINPGAPSSYLGQVATRSMLPNSISNSLLQFQSRSTHYARSNITSLQIVVPNFYMTANGPETGSGAAATITASVEYPSGTCNTLKFSGSTSGTAPNNGLLTSDAVSVTIPNGAIFFVRIHWASSTGIVWAGNGNGFLATDGFVFSSTTTPDLTQTCTTVANQTALGFTPAAIIGQTTRPSLFLAGDSRTFGAEDTADAYGDLGEFARSIGPSLAYINAGVSSDSVQEALTSYTNRLALSQYTSHVIDAYGINDISNGRTAAQLVTNTNSFIALFLGKEVWVATLPPVTTSSDSWATPTRTAASPNNQTVTGGNSVRITYNTDVRSGTSILGARGFIDISNVIESGWNSGYWIGPNCTVDGTHEGIVCALLEQESGVVPVGSFAR